MFHPLTSICSASTENSSLESTVLALDLLSSETAHELVHVLNYLRFLVRSNNGHGVSAELVDFAAPEIERLEQLLSHLRQFKLPALALKYVALADLLEQCAALFRDACARAHVELILEAAEHIVAYIDPAALTTVLRCLVNHALHHSARGSNILIRMAHDASSPGSVAVEIIDNGPLLPDPSPAALFDVWNIGTAETQTARRVFALRLVRNLGGTLTFEQTDGRNVFRISLPAARNEAR